MAHLVENQTVNLQDYHMHFLAHSHNEYMNQIMHSFPSNQQDNLSSGRLTREQHAERSLMRGDHIIRNTIETLTTFCSQSGKKNSGLVKKSLLESTTFFSYTSPNEDARDTRCTPNYIS